MGTCYELILWDEWNWAYTSSSKEDRLKRFEEEYGGYIKKLAEWDDFVVYDIDKSFPYQEDRLKLIREYADAAWYNTDSGDIMVKLDLPYNKPSVQEYIDDIDNRRTDEEKKASEDLVRQRLSRNKQRLEKIDDK